MKKQVLALLLGTAMCASVLGGCSNSTGNDTKDSAALTEAGDTAGADTAQAVDTTDTAGQDTAADPGNDNAEAGAETADPMEKISGSIYYYAFPVEGMDDMVQFFHFYGDDLGIGSVFYASYAWNQIIYSGTYTVEEADFDYTVDTDREGTKDSGTAPYTITFYDWDGNVLDTAGYDGDYFYNTTTSINADPATGGGSNRLTYADAAALETYGSVFDGELGIPYRSFVCPEDASATVTLNTNGTYEDMAVMAVEGTWQQTAEGEYTLTPDSDSDNGATLTLGEDGSYKYVSEDGTELVMNENKEAAVSFTFTGTFDLSGMEANLRIDALEDGTCKVVAGLNGAEMEVDAGTWSADEAFTFTFEFDQAGEIISEYGGDTGVIVNYTQTGVEAIGGGDIEAACGVVI